MTNPSDLTSQDLLLPALALGTAISALATLLLSLLFLRLLALVTSIEREQRNLSVVASERTGRILDQLLAVLAPGALRMVGPPGESVPYGMRRTTTPTTAVPTTVQRDAETARRAAEMRGFSDEIAALVNEPDLYPARRGTPPTPPKPPGAWGA